ncbi:nuclear transport factor 2 family protein [Acidithiobacillus ferrooxidans F221]|uniref:nuclear transport factor 2 family protein n=1 Tax=Acidithiobacillus ferrooxidans TaxID=920 RepID=UPI001C07179D|nr:nuclear transport factor 2 family protein [Acidithiobacillus ferrooxidans]MBU2809138.1 nuclear transport factor 2 family protein [Acidithiobacillus ferrooxidans F221]
MLDVTSLRALEEALLDQIVRQSPSRLSDLIADDFVEFGASGRVYTKQDVLDASSRLPDVVTPLGAFEVLVATADMAFVTYRSTIRDDDGTVREALRSSLWVLRDGRWQIRFHQGTSADRSSGRSASD